MRTIELKTGTSFKYLHDGLIRLVFEVFIPKSVELWSHFFQFLFSRTNLLMCLNPDNLSLTITLKADLKASIDGIRRQACPLRAHLPLGEYLVP
jgi:hypothetical protein